MIEFIMTKAVKEQYFPKNVDNGFLKLTCREKLCQCPRTKCGHDIYNLIKIGPKKLIKLSKYLKNQQSISRQFK